MCRFSEAELYWVSTKMRITFELMQYEMGTSTRRYLPPSGTAGFERSRVNGNSRLPAPPPRITANKLGLEAIRVGAKDIGKGRGVSRLMRQRSHTRLIGMYQIRKATLADRPAIAQLIKESARSLSREDYSDAQIEGAIAT